MIELYGRLVVLRALEREHCRELWENFEPVEPIPTEPLRPGLSVEGADRWFEEIQARQDKDQFYLGIFYKDQLVGDIQLSDIDWRSRTATIGFGISRQADRRQGYCLDAIRTLLRFAFEHLDLVRVSGRTAAYNASARGVLEKCGFVQEGCERQAFYCAGQRWDRLVYGLLRSEFERQNTSQS